MKNIRQHFTVLRDEINAALMFLSKHLKKSYRSHTWMLTGCNLNNQNMSIKFKWYMAHVTVLNGAII